MDPITIIVSALGLGAAAGLQATAEQAVKSGYASLKSLIQRRYAAAAPGIEQMERAPNSKARRDVVKEDLEGTQAASDAELLVAAKSLLDLIRTGSPETASAVGISLKEIEAASLTLDGILARATRSARGVVVEKSKFTGDVKISNISVGVVKNDRAKAADVPSEIRKIKILFLAANPTDLTALRLAEEVRAIDEALRMAQYRDDFDLEQLSAVRVNDLQAVLLRHRPHIVHFSGHGSDAGEIYLEDDLGTGYAVPPDALSTTFRLLKDNIKCVVLNACFSARQADALTEHIACVVGMSTEIEDRSSIRFASAFYQALAHGRDLKNAFELGRNQIDLNDLGDRDVPKLLYRTVDPTEIKFGPIKRT
jgi:hypothetical protein